MNVNILQKDGRQHQVVPYCRATTGPATSMTLNSRISRPCPFSTQSPSAATQT